MLGPQDAVSPPEGLQGTDPLLLAAKTLFTIRRAFSSYKSPNPKQIALLQPEVATLPRVNLSEGAGVYSTVMNVQR